MRLPRDMSGRELVTALRKLGYTVTRQRGSHIRITTLGKVCGPRRGTAR